MQGNLNVGAVGGAEKVTEQRYRERLNENRRDQLSDISGLGGAVGVVRLTMNPYANVGRAWGPYREVPLPPAPYEWPGFTQAQLIGWIDSGGTAWPGAPMDLPRSLALMPSIIAEDAQVREANDLSPRAPGDPIYTWPRSGASIDLSPDFRRIDTPIFKMQWTVFTNDVGRIDASTPVSDQFVPGQRTMLVAPLCSRTTPEPRSSADWKKHDVQVFLRTNTGERIPGPTVGHYADLSLARWWFEIALALSSDNRIIARLDSVSPDNGRFPQQDASGPPVGWYAQTYYVRAIAEAIANGYNALNIPWYIDPIARALYRDWLAGQDTDEFNIRSDYNGSNWFTNREQCGEKRYSVLRPRIQPSSWTNTQVGELPARLDRIWKETHRPGHARVMEFLQKAGVMLWSGSDSTDPYTAPSAVNRGFASGFAMGWDVVFVSPLALSREPTDAERELYMNASKRGLDALGQNMAWDLSDYKPTAEASFFREDWYASIVHAPPLQDRNNICDWRSAGFDPEGVAGVHVQGSVPLRWYLAWLREWATACSTIAPVSEEMAQELPTVDPGRRWAGFGSGVMPRRSPGSILRDARSYALDVNLAWASLLGGNGRFSEALVQKSTEFNRANPNSVIKAVGGVVSALGAPVLNAVVPGVGALATAGVGMVTELLSAAFPSYDCSGYGRDDLGRPKPNFERVSLSGNAQESRPPGFSLPVPFGFCRNVDVVPDPIPMIDRRGSTNVPPAETKSDGLGTMAKVGLAAAGAGTIALAVWVANRPKAT